MITWNIWGEAAERRSDELFDVLIRFPDSVMAPVWRKELDYLNYLRDHGACPGGMAAWEAQRKERSQG